MFGTCTVLLFRVLHEEKIKEDETIKNSISGKLGMQAGWLKRQLDR